MRKEISIFLFIIGVLLFSWPIMSIFRNILQDYLFAVWLLFIVLIYLIVTYSNQEDGGA